MVVMAERTMVINPAAGPETPILLLLIIPTIIPPIIPAIIPVKIFGSPSIPLVLVEASPTPRHSGSATKKTTMLAGKSCFQEENKSFMQSLNEFINFFDRKNLS